MAVPVSCRRLKTRALDLRGRVLSRLGYGLHVEAEHPVVREVFPELAAELLALLEEILPQSPALRVTHGVRVARTDRCPWNLTSLSLSRRVW
jgi:hypothetical protein